MTPSPLKDRPSAFHLLQRKPKPSTGRPTEVSSPLLSYLARRPVDHPFYLCSLARLQRRTGTVHFKKRAASAAIAFRSLCTLSSPAKGLTPENIRHLVQLVLRPRLLYGASIFSPREVGLRPMSSMALCCTMDPWGLQNHTYHIAADRGRPPPHPPTLQTRPPPLCPSHSMRLANH